MEYNAVVNKKDLQKFEQIAKDSEKHARLAIKKSNLLQTALSYMDYKLGKVKEYSSAKQLFQKLKI